jgi:hypothetical protein
MRLRAVRSTAAASVGREPLIAVHRMVGRVALQDLGDAGLEGEALAGGPGGHVRVDQRVHDRAVLALEGAEPGRVAALLGLERGAGVVGHQAAEPPVDAESLQVPGAVQRMQPRRHQRRGIADVVQPRRSDQDLPLVSGEHGGSYSAGLLGDRLDVRPAVAERLQEARCVAAGLAEHDAESAQPPGGR